jgi:hypothetical protein
MITAPDQRKLHMDVSIVQDRLARAKAIETSAMSWLRTCVTIVAVACVVCSVLIVYATMK